MTKIEFISALTSQLSGIPVAERKKPLEYYEEIICDRIEEGMTEDEAVAALGDIDKITEEILCSMPITALVKAKVSNHWEANKSNPHTSKTSNASNSLPSSTKRGDRVLKVKTSNADINIEFEK